METEKNIVCNLESISGRKILTDALTSHIDFCKSIVLNGEPENIKGSFYYFFMGHIAPKEGCFMLEDEYVCLNGIIHGIDYSWFNMDNRTVSIVLYPKKQE
ncbi:hypothetical protein F7644_09680 [Tenacibaculum finnmarkense genomovar ulcerans]|uniref:hypothetical protein n=1 Tax=Tenacibaculum finnmarkense TaxID=2781243 RepID=UPI00187B6E8E|nr:hypothetical protein [Tenacibaculum finnmarkense]MBE7646257.1 hypothetical protein [Tenacibaculum finnmarkense genomovar ulcerans]MCG8856716.1 hypothetical protein [Tenacibaculum finnmarkense]MDB0602656.1 hypothetical protein [Tenacibaculum maritimum]MDB0611233.1 hypothetical protein [Tenacibaculum maritimum]